ncbi:MAG: rRNA pseudouridine synthase [Lewinella sp.]|nr:rRNA pseudouridine synthase [Lewinella sp.]
MKKRPDKSNVRFRPSRARNAGKAPGIRQHPSDAVGMRLNKFVAHCGICSRRQAAELVKAGRVKVNDAVCDNPAYQIAEGDRIAFDGKPLELEEHKVYLLLNKPRGVLTTVKDDRGRKTVIDLLGEVVKERVFPVGRLDRDTAGLLLLTNDGDLAKSLMHPSHKVPKVYKATLDKALTKKDLEQLQAGVTLDDGPAPLNWINFPEEQDRTTVSLELHYGRNRIVRRLFEHLGYEVIRLDRIYLAGLTKKDLPRGYFRYLTEKEVIMLRHFVH